MNEYTGYTIAFRSEREEEIANKHGKFVTYFDHKSSLHDAIKELERLTNDKAVIDITLYKYWRGFMNGKWKDPVRRGINWETVNATGDWFEDYKPGESEQ
jgi:hypothetical protein